MLLKVAIKEIRYQKAVIVSDIDVNVSAGEIIAILGRNGSGKSSLIKSIIGMHTNWDGNIVLDDMVIQTPEPDQLKALGVLYLPQVDPVFEKMSVRDNLKISVLNQPSQLHHAIELLPDRIKNRLNENASILSGGEKQLLALTMIFVSQPRLVLLDEPCASLSSTAAEEILQHIKSMVLKTNMSAVIVEQKVHELLVIADRALVISDGVIAYMGQVTSIPKHLNMGIES